MIKDNASKGIGSFSSVSGLRGLVASREERETELQVDIDTPTH